MRKAIGIFLIVMVLFSFVSCGSSGDVGVILLHDESSTYDSAYIEGAKRGMENCGIRDSQVIWKYNVPEGSECLEAASDLAEQGCKVIISNSFGHEDFMRQAAEEYPETTFIATTGVQAVTSELNNFKNASPKVHEARYVSGVVAGLKVAELDKAGKLSAENYDADGNVKIGYVGAYTYAEVISGYTAFFQGIKSVYPDVTMDVTMSGSWYDEELERIAAEDLISRGCVIIGQHSDSTGAPQAVQAAYENGRTVFSVGFGIDMTEVAPDTALTSATNEWSAYFEYAIDAALHGEEMPTDWSGGFKEDAVGVTPFGNACAKGTQQKVEEVIEGIKTGTVKVFDIEQFTVNGEKMKTYPFNPWELSYDWSSGDGPVQGEVYEAVVDGQFLESEFVSAPYFMVQIDGINLINTQF